MHELSIAYSIVETSSLAAKEAGADRVDVVRLRIGALSGVVKQSLLFCWDVATKDTLLAGSKLKVEELPVVAYCPSCDENVMLPAISHFRCPECDTATPNLIQGKELEIMSLEIPDQQSREAATL